jgi:hypothetical protein
MTGIPCKCRMTQRNKAEAGEKKIIAKSSAPEEF